MTTYTITAEQLQQLLACVKAMYDYAGCRVHMQSYADQSADSLALLRKLQPNTHEPLTNEQINDLMQEADAKWSDADVPMHWARHFARAIEAAHGVKP